MLDINQFTPTPNYDIPDGLSGMPMWNPIMTTENFRRIVYDYMNSEARIYDYPDIFSAMSLKNSGVSELVAEGASWASFFDAGIDYINSQIKSEDYLNFSADATDLEISLDTNSPKLGFTPSITQSSRY